MKYLICIILSLASGFAAAETDFSDIQRNPMPYKYKSAGGRLQLLGDWCGEKYHDDGQLQRWQVTRFEDGTYKVHFHTVDSKGAEDDWTEVGLWGYRYPIYFTAARGILENDRIIPMDTAREELYDAYQVVALTENKFTYDSFTSGKRFTITKNCDKAKMEPKIDLD